MANWEFLISAIAIHSRLTCDIIFEKVIQLSFTCFQVTGIKLYTISKISFILMVLSILLHNNDLNQKNLNRTILKRSKNNFKCFQSVNHYLLFIWLYQQHIREWSNQIKLEYLYKFERYMAVDEDFFML